MKYKINPARIAAKTPRFPIWEAVAMLYIAFYSVTALASQRSNRAIESLLGDTYGFIIWYGGLFVVVTLWTVSMLLSPPNGIVVNLVSMTILFLLSFSVAVGLAIFNGTLFFSGNSGLWIFAIASFCQIIQLFLILSRTEKQLIKMPDRG